MFFFYALFSGDSQSVPCQRESRNGNIATLKQKGVKSPWAAHNWQWARGCHRHREEHRHNWELKACICQGSMAVAGKRTPQGELRRWALACWWGECGQTPKAVTGWPMWKKTSRLLSTADRDAQLQAGAQMPVGGGPCPTELYPDATLGRRRASLKTSRE